jgi:Fungal specific transcription factor domain
MDQRPHRQTGEILHLSEDMVDISGAETAIEHLMNLNTEQPSDTTPSPGASLSMPSAASVPQLSRLIRDAKGKFMFIGDSANLSFLQNIRRLVGTAIGPCSFVTDPLRHYMVEASPSRTSGWMDAHLKKPIPKPTLGDAEVLIRQYMRATNCVLDLLDESDLLDNLPAWLQSDSETSDSESSKYFLVMAIGAQTSPEDEDEIAGRYFNYGRYLTALHLMEDPSILTVQSYALITMYMLGAARRNAAFMTLGIAVRAAYALGLHRRAVSYLFNRNDCRTRERLWKVIRILDLFLSASLGRPPSTFETRNTNAKDEYSASASLCSIFETILIEVYSKRMVSTRAVEDISRSHREWTKRLNEGLSVDGIQPTDSLADGKQPNIGLYHLKEAYYWTIVLLTRPFLIDRVASLLAATTHETMEVLNETSSNQALVDACVDSSVRTIELLGGLNAYEKIPKRLPFVVNSIFVSALVIGVAVFGNLDRQFPLERSLQDAQTLLRRFSSHDAQAKRNLVIVEYLDEACKTYTEIRERQNRGRFREVVSDIFGRIEKNGHHAATTDKAYLTKAGIQECRPTIAGNIAPKSPAYNVFNDHHNSNHAPVEEETHMSQILSSWYAEGPANDHNGNHILPDGLDAYHDPDSEFSPHTLWFESYDSNLPLFSTLDTQHFL